MGVRMIGRIDGKGREGKGREGKMGVYRFIDLDCRFCSSILFVNRSIYY